MKKKVNKFTYIQSIILTLVLSILPQCIYAQEVDKKAIVLLFDLSFSMRRPIEDDGPAKIQFAREAFNKLANKVKPLDQIAVITFGNGLTGEKKKDCKQIEVLKEFSPKNSTKLSTALDKQEPNGRETPLAEALSYAEKYMLKFHKNGKIILISDGEETCKGNPELIAGKINQKGIKIDTVGIGQAGQFSQLGAIALEGGGTFELASNQVQLASILGKATGTGNLKTPSIQTSNKEPIKGAFEIKKSPNTSFLTKGVPLNPIIEVPVSEKKEQKLSDAALVTEIIFDASGSMQARMNAKKKILIAKDALQKTAQALEDPLILSAFRAYGFDSSVPKTAEASCPNTELLVPFAQNNHQSIISAGQNLDAYGYTPLALSLKLAGEDLKSFPNSQKTAVLISDGIETCGGDPIAELKKLKKQGIEIQVHVIGFDISKKERHHLENIAKTSGGRYYDAGDSVQLVNSLLEIVREFKVKAKEIQRDRFIRPVQGGNSLQNATKIGPGLYTLSKHLERGEEVFFYVSSKASQRIAILGELQSQRILKEKNQFIETTSGKSGLSIRIYAPETIDNAKIKPRRSVLVGGKVGTEGLTHYFDQNGSGVYFSIYGAYDRVGKDTLFQVIQQDAGDLNKLTDAPEKSGDALDLKINTDIVAHLGLEDKEDLYQIQLPSNKNKLKISIQFADDVVTRRAGIKPKRSPFIFKLEAKDAVSGKRLLRERSESAGEFTLNLDSSAQKINILISDANPSLYNMFSSYTLKVVTQ